MSGRVKQDVVIIHADEVSKNRRAKHPIKWTGSQKLLINRSFDCENWIVRNFVSCRWLFESIYFRLQMPILFSQALDLGNQGFDRRRQIFDRGGHWLAASLTVRGHKISRSP
jgi:hypothetical protein